jgi:hypothetical protein
MVINRPLSVADEDPAYPLLQQARQGRQSPVFSDTPHPGEGGRLSPPPQDPHQRERGGLGCESRPAAFSCRRQRAIIGTQSQPGVSDRAVPSVACGGAGRCTREPCGCYQTRCGSSGTAGAGQQRPDLRLGDSGSLCLATGRGRSRRVGAQPRPGGGLVLPAWHAVLDTGFLAVAGGLVGALVHNRAKGEAWGRALPPGYGLSFVGGLVFGAGGLGDVFWHHLFGVEQRLEALYSRRP